MRGRSGFAKAVKNVILKTAEKKFVMRDLKDATEWSGVGSIVQGMTTDNFGQLAVGHNQPFQIHIYNSAGPDSVKHPFPLQGQTDHGRNGDEIYATGLMLRIQMENDANRHNNVWRFWLIEWNSVQENPCVPDNFFFNIIGNRLLDTVQTDRYKARMIGTYRTKARDVAVDAKTNIFVKKWIPMRRKIVFRDDQTIIVSKGMKEFYTLMGVCYDSSNTLTTTRIGNVRACGTLYYKDP